MSINLIKSKLISMGYSPCDVEYWLSEVLQYKKPHLLNQTDIKILVAMLKQAIECKA